MKRRFWVLTALSVVAALVLVVALQGRRGAAVDVETGLPRRQATFRSTVTASGEIVATRYADIGSSVMGKVVSLPVREGDRVRAGQVLARIDAVQAASDVAGASAQVAALEAEERAMADQIRATTSDLAAAEARAKESDLQRDRIERLFSEGLVAAAERESAIAASDAARAQVAAVKAGVDRAKRSQEAAVRRVAQARAQQTRAQDSLTKTAIVSPIDGIVSRLRVREGEMVVVGIQNQPGTTLMTVARRPRRQTRSCGSAQTRIRRGMATIRPPAGGESARTVRRSAAWRRRRLISRSTKAAPVTPGSATARNSV